MLANPAVHVAIVGTRNLTHVDEAIAAAGLPLDASINYQLRARW